MSIRSMFFISGDRVMMRAGSCVGRVIKNRDSTLEFVGSGAWKPTANLPRGHRWHSARELCAALDRELAKEKP